MGIVDALVILAIGAWLVFAVRHIKSRKGKCPGNCDGCPNNSCVKRKR